MRIDDHPPFAVREIPHIFVPIRGGERISVRLFLPEGMEQHPVPAILDMFPYRKSDLSAWRDTTTLAWLAGQGYACVKADARGVGDSDGFHLDQMVKRK